MSDLLKGLTGGGWAGLYAWVFPSALVVGLFWLLIYPQMDDSLRRELTAVFGAATPAVFPAIAAALGFCLQALSTPLYRLLEGYSWPEWARSRGEKAQRKIRKTFEPPPGAVGWRRGLTLEGLERFPTEEAQVAPTRLGNALRAFETYGKNRFNLDSQTMWSELCAVAPKYLQEELDRSRASVDFFVAMVYLSTFFGIASLAVGFAGTMTPVILIAGVAGMVLTVLWYRMAVVSSSYWRGTVQALVNIGRIGLAEKMGLRIPDTIDEEREMWGLVTKFVFFGYGDEARQLDKFRKIGPTATPDDDAGDDPEPAGDDEDEGP